VAVGFGISGRTCGIVVGRHRGGQRGGESNCPARKSPELVERVGGFVKSLPAAVKDL
jgi:hypothetical protein